MSEELKIEQGFAESILRSAQVKAYVNAKANEILHQAQASAPVESGAYRDSLHIARRQSKYREVVLVESDVDYALAIESKRGTLARALRSSKK